MDRTLFFQKEVVDGIKELDFMNNNLTGFVLARNPLYYRVVQGDMQVPDLISYKVYGEERFWWVICLANNVYNIPTDLVVGQLLTIPNILDIYDFFRAYRKR